MNSQLNSFLKDIEMHIDYAFQPIVNIHTGVTYGYEALLRNQTKLGLSYIHEIFDHAWENGIIHQTEIILRQKALEKFSRIHNSSKYRLFFNMDGRVFESPDYYPNKTTDLLQHYNLPADSFCIEMSESYDNSKAKHISDILLRCREQNFRLALDDYGRGFSELKMLYDYQPDYLKIDRFFIHEIAEDQKKRLLVANMVKVGHALGILVIAEGIETAQDFIICREIGCDLAQGYLISRPQLDIKRLNGHYKIVTTINEQDRRRKINHDSGIETHIQYTPPVKENDLIHDVLDLFKNNPDRTFFPVIDEKGEARGILREFDLKNYIYNRYGHALLNNKGLGRRVVNFMTRCAIADIHQSLDEILHIYATNNIHEGILISKNFQYHGFLTNQALLKIINQRQLIRAQDQNPLTKLPGNQSISDFITSSISTDSSHQKSFVYFDFNDFKPFNDYYGFRQGDRAILLFSEILKKNLQPKQIFIGHIGGDDFFAGFTNIPHSDVYKIIENILEQFNEQVQSFYSIEDRSKGFIMAKNRDGYIRKFGFLSVCAAMLTVNTDIPFEILDKVIEKLAYLKKQAKSCEGSIAFDLIEKED